MKVVALKKQPKAPSFGEAPAQTPKAAPKAPEKEPKALNLSPETVGILGDYLVERMRRV